MLDSISNANTVISVLIYQLGLVGNMYSCICVVVGKTNALRNPLLFSKLYFVIIPATQIQEPNIHYIQF